MPNFRSVFFCIVHTTKRGNFDDKSPGQMKVCKANIWKSKRTIFHQAKCWRKSISKKANYQWTSTLQEKCDLTQENVKRFNWVMQSWAELTELSFFTPFKKNKLWNFLQNRKSKSHNYRKLWGLFFDRQAKTNVTLGIYLNHDATCRSSHPWH